MRTETERLMKDLKTCACDAEDLIKAKADEINDKTHEARLRLKATLNSAKELKEKTVNGVKAADRVIRANPYPTLGIALGVGVLLGILIGRRA
jgi:ElaB/YqjD/DUF883 family membrane-anchored ribosome-binding protein